MFFKGNRFRAESSEYLYALPFLHSEHLLYKEIDIIMKKFNFQILTHLYGDID